ncbi:MAG: carbohydrate ABC transporter permease [Clostridiaceae bacterium]
MLLLPRTFKYILLSVLSAVFLFPVAFTVANSFITGGEIAETYFGEAGAGFILIPGKASLIEYYHVFFRSPMFLRLFWNSVLITAPVVAGQVVVSSMAAFAFAKLRFPLRGKLFFIYIVVMMMPFQVTLVPNYITLSDLGLIGSYASVILPGIFTTFGTFLLRQFMVFIPDEYIDAARMDGAGSAGLFLGIVMPQVKAGVASLAILSFIDNWNMVEQPLIFLKEQTMMPLSIVLNSINSSDIGIAFVCGVIFMTPPVLLFLYGKDNLVQGIQMSGIR